MRAYARRRACGAFLTLPLNRHATRNFDALGVDPAIVVGQQRRDHGADIVRQSGATERRHVGDSLVEFGIVANNTAAEIGGDGSGCNDVGATPTPISVLYPRNRQLSPRFIDWLAEIVAPKL